MKFVENELLELIEADGKHLVRINIQRAAHQTHCL